MHSLDILSDVCVASQGEGVLEREDISFSQGQGYKE